MTTQRPHQPWRRRVVSLLDDPAVQSLLRRDGLTNEDVFDTLEPIARHLFLKRQAAGAERVPCRPS
ncbi:hypothetical protein [Azospirillum sp. SYSU D00513]|uniref:hypothetical protein n=1 Tax=Azospirillum sp. SYSU D00513 TaxID=2812561 RepID=UPI001A96AF65|nr:hypothetical protein [Azospirillum sp. SYSU D00513]